METNDFIRAETDKKEYRLICLENGLEVLLVSDQSRAKSESFSDDDNEDDENDEEDSEMEGESDDENDDQEEEIDDDDDDGENHATAQTGGCAVAMAVGCGSFHEAQEDPQGLAHLLEHMCFMGSTKYPTENEYDNYLSKHGGYSNAYTETEHTLFHFELGSASALPKAMDIFAQFFIAPLMLPSALEREIQAVDSEFDLALGDDELRMRALWSIDSTTTTGEFHPYKRFLWGNRASLLTGDVVRLQEQLRMFYFKHYHASNMKLVVWSTDDLNTVETQVRTCFGPIPPSTPDQIRAAAPKLSFPHPFPKKELAPFVFKLRPLNNDVHSLRLTWQSPPLATYTSKPSSYLAHLLGHESEGGLHHYLKTEKLATEVWAGMGVDDGEECNSIVHLFSIEIKLTERGVHEFKSVIAAIYAYLHLLKREGVQEWVFEEINTITKLAFMYRDDGDPSDEASDMAVKLLDKRLEHTRRDLFISEALMFSCNKTDIDSLLLHLGDVHSDFAPRIDFMSSTFSGEDFPLVQPFWNTRYAVHVMDDIDNNIDVAAHGFHLPPRNHFIPSEPLQVFELDSKRKLLEAQFEMGRMLFQSRVEIHTRVSRNSVVWLPAKITQVRGNTEFLFEFETGETSWFELESDFHHFEQTSTFLFSNKQRVRVVQPGLGSMSPLRKTPWLWTLQDAKHCVPRSCLFVFVRIQPLLTLKQRVWADLLCGVIMNHVLSHDVYLAKMAELDVHIRFNEMESGFSVRVLGFSPHIVACMKLVLSVLKRALDFPHTLIHADVLRFEQEAWQRYYSNAESELDVHANNTRLRALTQGFANRQLLEEVKTNIEPLVLPIVGIESFYHGNVNAEETHRAQTMMHELFPHKGASLPKRTLIVVPRQQSLLLLESHVQSEKNLALQVYFQLGEESLANLACAELLESLMEEPFFHELRTVQQVGYMVSVSVRRTLRKVGFAMEISSSKFPLFVLLEKIELFLVHFRKHVLGTLDEEELKRRGKSISKRLLQKDAGIFQESKRHWQCILEQAGFHENVLLAHAISHAPRPQQKFGVSVKDVCQLFDAYFLPHTRHALTIAVIGGANACTSVETERLHVPSTMVLFESLEEFWASVNKAANTNAEPVVGSKTHKKTKRKQ